MNLIIKASLSNSLTELNSRISLIKENTKHKSSTFDDISSDLRIKVSFY